VLIVRIEVIVPFAAGVTEAGERVPVTVAFTGETAKVSATARLNPFSDVTVIVDMPLFPTIAVAEAGDADKLKSFKVNV
jgi:hypothetical protein